MGEIFYDLTKPQPRMNYRWVQPPQIAYFVTTVDRKGNVNSTPATLGTCVAVDMTPESCGNYFLTFSLGSVDLEPIPTRDGHKNLREVPECVVSYIGKHLIRESQIACCPLPRGISEIDVAGMTELPSKHVRPPGIRECGVNIEARVIHSHRLGDFYTLYICRVVGVSVDEELVKRDAESRLHAGVWELDPVFETSILAEEGHPTRLYYSRLDKKTVARMPTGIGPQREWVGRFEEWMEDEVARGAISRAECDRIVALQKDWVGNPDPETNGTAKRELTEFLSKLVANKRGHAVRGEEGG
jgi:flavin reductase (DIM6/NTAB) family NADH-FMN oxidoreductase RutF